jgi:uncharacterized beta-barrel protein YwiB (DUF1934 family)
MKKVVIKYSKHTGWKFRVQFLNGLWLMMAVLLSLSSDAQKRGRKEKQDTLAPLRDFVNISSGYKQLPLHLKLEIRNSTNFITNEADTVNASGDFYIRKENSYVQFDEFEQVVNDSIAVLISHKLQQMIVFTNAGPIVSRMLNMMGATLPDSSVKNLSVKYSAVEKEISEKQGAVTLESRMHLFGTSLPKETISLEYSRSSRMPEKVTTVKRSLLQLDSIQYQQLQQEPDLIKNLLALEGSYFLIKEQVTAYIYNQRDKDAMVKVPVKVTDRVMAVANGEFTPAKGYETYQVIVNE